MSEPYDHARWNRSAEEGAEPSIPAVGTEDVEEARENVFEGWPSAEDAGRVTASFADEPEPEAAEPVPAEPDPAATSVWRMDEPEEPGVSDQDGVDLAAAAVVEEVEPEAEDEPEPGLEPEPDPEREPVALVAPDPVSHEHAPGELDVPPGYGVLEGVPDGRRRAVAVVVARFNGEITGQLLASALDELDRAGVAKDAVTVMPVPGAFELPIGAMALARTRRFACVVALGCVIRGDTPHFDYVASEAASGLQLAALETGVPVAFGVLTLDREEQATARIVKGAEAVRTALEMADLFSHLRAAAAR